MFALFCRAKKMDIKELTTVNEMVNQLETIKLLYPSMTTKRYRSFLNSMTPMGYQQIALFESNICIGMTGFWIGTKLWTGKYIEIDNFVVHPEYRNKGIGKQMTDYLERKALALKCTCIVLDAYTENFTAHRFYYNQGYVPRGFHFIKTIDENGFS